jgi:ferredoxin, 2Fe-2S
MKDIKIRVEQPGQPEASLHAPVDMGLSLMEFLKGNDYDIPATCGGMALCATCHVEVLEGYDRLGEIGDDEHAMLDTLPNITPTSRLSCQIRLSGAIDGLAVRIIGDGV